MVTTQLMSGKGTEYILSTELQTLFNINVIHNNAFENNRRCYEEWKLHDLSRLNKTTDTIKNQVIPAFVTLYSDKKIPTTMGFNVDSAGVGGDTADIYFEDGEWPNISLKNNSAEIKSLRYKYAEDYSKIFGTSAIVSSDFKKEFDNIAMVMYPDTNTKFSNWKNKTLYYDACINAIKNEMTRMIDIDDLEDFIYNFNQLILGTSNNNIIISIKKTGFTFENRKPVKKLISIDTGKMKNNHMNRIIFNFLDIDGNQVSYQNRVKNGNTYTHSSSQNSISGLKSSFTKIGTI